MTLSLRRHFVAAVLATAAFGVSAHVGRAAGSSGDVTSELKAYRIVEKGGAEQRLSAERIAPGETLEYEAHYRNTGKRDVRALQATLPIPASLVYVAGSATPGARASVDGTNFAGMPLKRRVKNADGTFKIVDVPLSQYRYLRWTIGSLPAGGKVSVQARARLAR
ncbi:MAG TPA: hypothetical protein VF719_13210 [Abditibacteriaceae bacterium]|jgi:uncharacterized repeat protein (TIGR01451 family)